MNERIEYSYFKELKIVSEKLYYELMEVNENDIIKKIIKTAVYIFNASFACEIGLKTIIMAEDSINKVTGHKLNDLYIQLSLNSKQFIESKMSKLQLDNNDIQHYLSIISDNFVDWRYFYETEDKNGNAKSYETNCLFIYDFLNAIEEFILK